jgi:hypothetical protein
MEYQLSTKGGRTCHLLRAHSKSLVARSIMGRAIAS